MSPLDRQKTHKENERELKLDLTRFGEK